MKSNKVILKEDFFFHEQYYKGDIFIIINSSHRGWDIQCERNNRIIYECLFIQDIFDYCDIKQIRKEKLEQINKKSSSFNNYFRIFKHD